MRLVITSRRLRLLAAAAITLAGPALSASPAGAAGASSAARQRADRAAAAYARAQSSLARAEDALSGAERRAAATRTRLTGLRAAVRITAVRRYVMGGAPALGIGSDLARMTRGRTLVDVALRTSLDSVDEYRTARDDLARTLVGLRRGREQRRSALTVLREQRTRALVELNRLVAAERAAATRAAGGRSVGRGRGGVRARASRDGTIVDEGGSGWLCPVAGPNSFSNDFGDPRSGGRRHQGNDMLAQRGTPAVAPVSGVARHHGSSLGGLSYYLDGDDGNTYFGTHLDRYGEQGRVQRGTVIGYVGNSGNARGGPNHLHFEIHPGGGAPVNPYTTLRAAC